jgi:DNA-binding LacI/PurR family transcriptional regulator
MVRKYSSKTIAFGSLLREILKQTHISRESLADGLQCSVDAVDNWCCGRACISADRLNELTSYLTMMKVNPLDIRRLYEEAIRAHGFLLSSHKDGKDVKFTLCLLGSLSHRKELRILQIMSDFMDEAGHKTIVLHCGERLEMVLSGLDLAEEIGAANLVLCGISAPPDVYKLIIQRMDGQCTRVFHILTNCPAEVIGTHKNAYAITWSNFGLAYKATSLLIQSGHTRIGTVRLEKQADRFSGYLQALKDNGIKLDEGMVIDSNLPINASSITDERFMRELEEFVLQNRMTAIFAPSELLTLAIPILLLKHKKRLYYDISFCGLAYPGWLGQGLGMPITYLRYPTDEVGRMILKVLLRYSANEGSVLGEQFADVTDLAKRIDMCKSGSIKPINPETAIADLDELGKGLESHHSKHGNL